MNTQRILCIQLFSQLLSLRLQAQSAEERTEEGGGSVQAWHRAFFSPFFPLKCDCCLLRRNWVFQEQPRLSKLALGAAGHTRTPPDSFGPFLVCNSQGGSSELRIHISGSVWWWVGVGGDEHKNLALIDLWPYLETERVIVSFTLTESNK